MLARGGESCQTGGAGDSCVTPGRCAKVESLWQTTSVVRRLIARVLILSQLMLTLSSCVSVRATGSRDASGPGGGIAVQVFEDDAAWRAGNPGPAGVMGELEHRQGATWVPVFRSLDPTWAVAGLPAGEYRLHFPARLDESGNVVRLADHARFISVQQGKITQVRAVLRHVPPALVALAVVTVVVVAVLLADWLKDHDLPLPPPPPPEVVEAVFYLSFDFGVPEWYGLSDRAAPQVTSHFPASGALVAARRVRIVYALSEPARPTEVGPQAVTVLGEASGIVPGTLSYDAKNWWVVWEPRTDLARGDTYHVTLSADAVEDQAGNELPGPVSFSFRTAR